MDTLIGNLTIEIETWIEEKRAGLPKDMFEFWLLTELQSNIRFIIAGGDDLVALHIASIRRDALKAALED